MGAGGCNEEKYPSNGTIDYNLIEKIISKSLSSINWKYYIDDKFLTKRNYSRDPF